MIKKRAVQIKEAILLTTATPLVKRRPWWHHYDINLLQLVDLSIHFTVDRKKIGRQLFWKLIDRFVMIFFSSLFDISQNKQLVN